MQGDEKGGKEGGKKWRAKTLDKKNVINTENSRHKT